MDRIHTKDIFRAAYHITRENRLFAISFNEEGEKEFIIKGIKLYSEDLKYCTGQALINPLVFEKSYRFLEDINRQNLPPFQAFGLLGKNLNIDFEIEDGI